MKPSVFTDNAVASRIEIHEFGSLTYANYRREGDRLFIDHVETKLLLRGTGAAGRLMEAVVAFAHREGLRVVPVCGYAAAWLSRQPDAVQQVSQLAE